ncbi:YbaB/EbfC family nucleoid-associated protein [Actinoplanes sp. NPDC049316]|uniref:YbaB/EbfC family nucleoid-associated protein n=1 Tax=Actinoplanes sp. NPDC049316 TaxID=3154727 RepID=UPI003433E333
MTGGFPEGEGLLDPDGARAYLADWKSRIDRKAADTQAMSDRLGHLRVTAEDGNGIAEVTIDSGGVLVDLRLTDRIHRLAPDVVSRAVLGALREARRKAAEQSRQIITETMGGDSVAARTIADRLDHQLRDGE